MTAVQQATTPRCIADERAWCESQFHYRIGVKLECLLNQTPNLYLPDFGWQLGVTFNMIPDDRFETRQNVLSIHVLIAGRFL